MQRTVEKQSPVHHSHHSPAFYSHGLSNKRFPESRNATCLTFPYWQEYISQDVSLFGFSAIQEYGRRTMTGDIRIGYTIQPRIYKFSFCLDEFHQFWNGGLTKTFKELLWNQESCSSIENKSCDPFNNRYIHNTHIHKSLWANYLHAILLWTCSRLSDQLARHGKIQ